MYQYNIKPIKMLVGTIDGQAAFARNELIAGVENYKKALSYQTVLDRDSRTSLIRSITSFSYTSLFAGLDKDQAQDILDYTIAQAEANVKYNQNDSLMQMQLAQILDAAANFNANAADKFFYFSDRSLEAIDKSIASSPGRVPIYFSKAQIYLNRGEKEKAVETLKYAVSLNEDYVDSYCQLARVYLSLEQTEEGMAEMDKCLDQGGISLISSANFIKNLINYYFNLGDQGKVLILYERLSALEANNPEIWVNLAKLYVQTGQKEKAIAAAQKAAELDRNLEAAVEDFISNIK